VTDKYLIAWMVMPIMTIVNASIRELTYKRYVSELLSHQISTLTGIVLLGRYVWFLSLRRRIQSTVQALATVKDVGKNSVLLERRIPIGSSFAPIDIGGNFDLLHELADASANTRRTTTCPNRSLANSNITISEYS